jgi:carbon monoxide dehydrogenase subunit G
MELEHSFTVPLPEERTWEVLLDVERVAPCMPGATLDSVDGDEIKGRIKVKVGPIAMTYAGTARFTERDPQAHVITLEASGKETRGAGTASARVRSMLEGQDGQTHVIVHTTLNVTGRPAQFGRGVMAEVGGKLIGVFASNLADMLAADPARQPAGGNSGDAVQGDGEAGGDLATPIESMNLSLRSYNSLSREGIHTVGDLAAKTREELLAIDHIGPASVEEIRQKLADQGLTLADSPASGNGLPASPPAPPAPAGHPPTVPSRITAAPSAGSATAGSATASYDSARASDDDAIDLLSVAGVPVLKRAAPVAAAIAVIALIAVRLRARRRRSRG